MKALVYDGPGKKAVEERPKPEISAPTDATHDHDQAGRHRDDADAAEDSAVAQDCGDQTHNPSVQVRKHSGSI